MRITIVTAGVALVLPLLIVATGCGGSSTSSNSSAGPSVSDKAQDVADMLKEYYEVAKKAPMGLAQLSDASASHPVGHAAVASGEYVVLWKVPISAAGAGNVLAYPKEANTAGGSIVMQDGSVKQMTADEFKSAPKAKP